DFPTSEYEDPAPSGCEPVEERPPNSFRPPDTPPEEPVEPPPPGPGPNLPLIRDTKPLQTRIGHRPQQLLIAARGPRRVVFRFTAGEPGTRFRCRIDRRPFTPCV